VSAPTYVPSNVGIGRNLDELYITTARSDYNGEALADKPYGGDLFVVKGMGYTGIERKRFNNV
jgi:sugar lactone lactonase YvrE